MMWFWRCCGVTIGHGIQPSYPDGHPATGKVSLGQDFLVLAVYCWESLLGHEGVNNMKVWIDQDLCTGDGLCEEIAPDVFTLLDDGLAYVREKDKIFATAKGNPQGAEGMAEIPDNQLDAVIESAEECPGECIFIEP
jgi:ferredoxin